MKKSIRFISLLTAIVLCLAMLSACGGEEKNTNGTPDKLTYWGVMDTNSQVSIKSYSELLLYQKMQEATGIDVDFIHPIAGSTGNEAFITMLSGGELPDIIEYGWNSYDGGPQGAVDDGVIIALNDYLEEYAPNYYDYLEGEKGKANDYLYKYQASSSEGVYYGFNRLNIGTARIFSGLFVRADKLQKWGMDVPETIDDWTALFAKAKAEGIEAPFTCTGGTFTVSYSVLTFQNAFDVGAGYYLNDDGKVVFAPFEKGYKEFVAQMAQWMKDGYIDSGFVTNAEDEIRGKMVHGTSIATMGGIGGSMGAIIPAGQKLDPDFMLAPCPWPVAKKGDSPKYIAMTDEASPTAAAISAECAYPETAIKWCDYVYSEEGFLLQTFGVEGDTYTIEERDGEKHYVYTDKILKPESSGVNTVSEAMYKYMLPANHPGLDQHPDYLDGYYQLDAQKEAIELWNKHNINARANDLPTLQYTEEEARLKTDILAVAFDPLEVAIYDIILGKKGIDTYDAAVQKAKNDGYDELLDIYQSAYDRYVTKFN